MKTGIAIAAIILLAWLGWRLAAPKTDLAHQTDHAEHSPLMHIVSDDPVLIFQKAFWKRPTPEDQILHAERREWHDKDGVSKWEWFISVRPSSFLVDHLITHNAFMLTPAAPSGQASSRHLQDAAPKWFPAFKAEPGVLVNATGSFQLLWDKENNLLHATDCGSGFRPGAPEPARPVATTPPEGRLPTTPPPRP